MLSIYTSYKCRTCQKEFVLLSDDIDTMDAGRYIVCPYCNSKRVIVGRIADNLKESMSERSYRRHNGAMAERR
jgi:DNA-directed RNA polymerase subunit RPC12/RpoP